MAGDVFGIVGSVIASVYHVESVVAEGRGGVVYRAHHGARRAPVALKLLKVPAQSPQQRAAFGELFRGEGELLVRLSASLPNLVRVLLVASFTSRDGRFVPYLVLEWLEGMTLEALIAQRKREKLAPISLRKLVRLLTPVARTLERAHDFSGLEGPISVVHGDLEPDNLFIAQVAGEELVKILNFALGKVKSVASQFTSQDGSTPLAFAKAYGAPEQWAPQHYGPTGPWTDVWGLARCLVEAMAAHTPIEGEPRTMIDVAHDLKRRPTPRNEGIDLPPAVEAVFERALALDPRARQPHVGVFWDELVAALAQADAAAKAPAIEAGDDLEFDPISLRQPVSTSLRVSAPYASPRAAPESAARTSRPPAFVSATNPARAAAVSAAHYVPDLELAPPPPRRASGERPVAPSAATAESNLIDLASVSPVAALDLDLDLPADEPRARRNISSHTLAAVRSGAQRSSVPPSPRSFSGSLPAVREPPSEPATSAVTSARSVAPDLHDRVARAAEPPRLPGPSQPASLADVSGSFAAGFVAKIDPKRLEGQGLAQRLRPAIALLGAAILVALCDPIYASATGKLLEILGQRLSLLAAALLMLAVGLAVREVTRPQ